MGEKPEIALALLLGLYGLPFGATAQTEATGAISKSEVYSLAPGEVSQRVIGELAHMLTPLRPALGQKLRRPLTRLSFSAKPRSVSVPGLCELDVLEIRFDAATHGKAGPDTPAQPVGFTAGSYFLFITPPPGNFYSARNEETAQRSAGQCTALDPEKTGFFDAPDEEVAADGYWLLTRVLAGGGANPIPFALTCAKTFRGEAQDCPAILARQRNAHVDSIKSCDPGDDDPPTTACFDVTVPDQDVKIFATPGTDNIGPTTIRRVDMHDIIMLRDRAAE